MLDCAVAVILKRKKSIYKLRFKSYFQRSELAYTELYVYVYAFDIKIGLNSVSLRGFARGLRYGLV